MDQFLDAIAGLRYHAGFREAARLVGYMLIGGCLGLYVRLLYRRFGMTVSNRDSFSGLFPLLTVAIILVIFVVKSSLALSLGLVGALSIVRFRAAIKEPEELIYLFFCIAVGLALGAEYLLLAVGGTLMFTLFVLLRHRGGRKGRSQTLLLTISGAHADVFDGDQEKITAAVGEVAGAFRVQRLEVDDDQVQFRATVTPESQEQIGAMVAALRTRLPACRVSYVNLENLL